MFETFKGIPIDWCELCQTAVIICTNCKNTSCNCGSCEVCRNNPIHKEFDLAKTHIEDYLTKEEIETYHKCMRIKHHIMRSLGEGKLEIDFSNKKAFSKNDQEMFNLK